MLAYQQQQQQQPQPGSGSSNTSSVVAATVGAASTNNHLQSSSVTARIAAIPASRFKFGNAPAFSSFSTTKSGGLHDTSIANRTLVDSKETKQQHHIPPPFPKSFGASNNTTTSTVYRLHHTSSTAVSNGTNGPSSSAHSLQGPRVGCNGNGLNRNVNPAFAAPHWQNYHNHYHQQHKTNQSNNNINNAGGGGYQMRRNGGGVGGLNSIRPSDLNKQWRAPPSPAKKAPATTATHRLTINTAKAAAMGAARENSTLMSSTYQGDNDSPLLSGLSLALNKHKIKTPLETSLYDFPQQRTPNPLSPAISMKAPGYVDPESLPFELGSSIANANTGKQYKLLSVLGEGSYAVVYLAQCHQDGAKYALKCLSKLGLSARQLSLQRAELEIHASVCPHPHIVTLYSHFETRDWLFLVMERVSGPDLYDYITQHPAFNSNQEERRFVEATRLFEQMIDAVAHTHALKAYHRDLKPENFILGPDGNLKLTDFGLATREPLSVDFECGSKPYMSYENRNGGLNPDDSTVYGPRDDYSPRLSDVWALGVLFLNLLFAQSPWNDPSRESCFKFCRFLREGAGFLVSQFPKLPREVADFLVTRVFSPEGGRCNVLELKHWVQELGYPFNPNKVAAVATADTTAMLTAAGAPRSFTKPKQAVAVDGQSRRPHNANATAASAAAVAHPSAAGTAGKKWVMLSNSRNATTASTTTANAIMLTADSGSVAAGSASSKPKSPFAKKGAAFNMTKMNNNRNPHHLHADKQQSQNLSTSVPALVFSQIIPATKAAAARKMMPRENNHTAAKAAAAILQSSMLCLPKNGLGQGKQQDDTSGDEETTIGASKSKRSDDSQYHLEELSEIEEGDDSESTSLSDAEAPAYNVAATKMASQFPKQSIAASSLNFNKFSATTSAIMFDSEDEMDFSEPLSFDDDVPVRHIDHKKISSRPAPKASFASSYSGEGGGILGNQRYPSSGQDDGFDVLGHFSDDEEDGGSGSHYPQQQQQLTPSAAAAVVPVYRGNRIYGNSNSTNSADSSLTATLVTSSVEYYSPHMLHQQQQQQHLPSASDVTGVAIPRSSTAGAGYGNESNCEPSDESDADDEGDSQQASWRRRNSSVAFPTNASRNHVSQRQQQQQPYRLPKNARHRVHGSAAINGAMHSLPAPIHKPFGDRKDTPDDPLFAEKNDGNVSFSWADDVEDLPLPAFTNKLSAVTIADNADNESLMSWSANDSSYQNQNDEEAMFAMDL